VLVLAGSLGAAGLRAQSPAGGDTSGQAQAKPAAKPPESNANPFPEDTSSVPILPSTAAAAQAQGTLSDVDNSWDSSRSPLHGDDTDPVRSPDDPAPDVSAQDEDSSSSLKGMEGLLPASDTEEPRKHRKMAVTETAHKESSSTDLNVGMYYLDKKNWKAAFSRFQSAMVLDPENPDVYWGLAESERHLGDLASARAHYEKLLEYDPDGPHGKEARKALKDPALAATQKPAPGQTPSVAPN
jgi:tetratricopeptide (TPR) repeat protein